MNINVRYISTTDYIPVFNYGELDKAFAWLTLPEPDEDEPDFNEWGEVR